MPENSAKTAADRNARASNLTIEVLVSLATAPVLVALVGGKLLSQTIWELGRASEELFRGDRLPLLDIPPNQPPSPNTPHSN